MILGRVGKYRDVVMYRVEISVVKNRKQFINLIFLSAGCSFLRAEGFSCSLDVLCGGIGIRKLQFLILKNTVKEKISAKYFFQFCSSKPGSASGPGFT